MRKLRATTAFALSLALSACSADRTSGIEAPDSADARSSGVQPTGGPAPDSAVARLEVEYMSATLDHHTSGIALAQLCVHQAHHADLRTLCQTNVDAQAREAHQLQGWLAAWYGVSHASQVGATDHELVQRLSALHGGEFETEFMKAFRAHLQQLVHASQNAAAHAHHHELGALAQGILHHQSADVAHIEHWLCALYGLCHP